jgi:hypothetical protein
MLYLVWECPIFLIFPQSDSVLRFEERMLRRILGPKRRYVEGGWRMVHNKELHNLYS